MPKSIVCDASCLILLNKIGRLDLLQRVYGKVFTTDVVSREFGRLLPQWVEVSKPTSATQESLLHILDAGEASVIALAADFSNALLIIDEAKGRKVAQRLGLNVTGTLGVLVVAKQKGIILSVKLVLDEIADTNFRISPDLIRRVLKSVNEA